MHQAGPAIFPIDETKDHCHETNSVVDCRQSAAFVFHAHFVAREIDVVDPKSGFVDGRGGNGMATSGGTEHFFADQPDNAAKPRNIVSKLQTRRC
jgi:hypothetical protein